MKRTTLGISILFCLFLLTNCGGGSDSKQQPPSMGGGGGGGGGMPSAQSLKDLHCVSQDTQEVCCSQGVQTMQAYSGYCSQQATGQSYALPPQVPPQQGQVPSQKQGCASQSQPITCNQAMQNFELQFSTTYGAQAGSAEPQQWRQNQGKSVVNCVGQQMGITSVDQISASPQLQCMVSMTSQSMQAPPSVTASVPVSVTTVTTTSGNAAIATTPNTTALTMPTPTTAPNPAGTPTCGGEIVCL